MPEHGEGHHRRARAANAAVHGRGVDQTAGSALLDQLDQRRRRASRPLGYRTGPARSSPERELKTVALATFARSVRKESGPSAIADGPSLGRNAKQAAREGALPVALEMCDVPIWFQVRCNGAAQLATSNRSFRRARESISPNPRLTLRQGNFFLFGLIDQHLRRRRDGAQHRKVMSALSDLADRERRERLAGLHTSSKLRPSQPHRQHWPKHSMRMLSASF